MCVFYKYNFQFNVAFKNEVIISKIIFGEMIGGAGETYKC